MKRKPYYDLEQIIRNSGSGSGELYKKHPGLVAKQRAKFLVEQYERDIESTRLQDSEEASRLNEFIATNPELGKYTGYRFKLQDSVEWPTITDDTDIKFRIDSYHHEADPTSMLRERICIKLTKLSREAEKLAKHNAIISSKIKKLAAIPKYVLVTHVGQFLNNKTQAERRTFYAWTIARMIAGDNKNSCERKKLLDYLYSHDPKCNWKKVIDQCKIPFFKHSSTDRLYFNAQHNWLTWLLRRYMMVDNNRKIDHKFQRQVRPQADLDGYNSFIYAMIRGEAENPLKTLKGSIPGRSLNLISQRVGLNFNYVANVLSKYEKNKGTVVGVKQKRVQKAFRFSHDEAVQQMNKLAEQYPKKEFHIQTLQYKPGQDNWDTSVRKAKQRQGDNFINPKFIYVVYQIIKSNRRRVKSFNRYLHKNYFLDLGVAISSCSFMNYSQDAVRFFVKKVSTDEILDSKELNKLLQEETERRNKRGSFVKPNPKYIFETCIKLSNGYVFGGYHFARSIAISINSDDKLNAEIADSTNLTTANYLNQTDVVKILTRKALNKNCKIHQFVSLDPKEVQLRHHIKMKKYVQSDDYQTSSMYNVNLNRCDGGLRKAVN